MPTAFSSTRLPEPKNTLYLVDISSFIFRAFFAIRTLHNRAGEPTNAVYGVATMLARLADDARPEYLAVVYDSKEPSFRKDIYPQYKANRSAPPEDLVPQFSRIEELIRSFEIHSYRQSGVEADDLIATLTKNWCKASSKNHVVIVTSDKDLMQLVNDRVITWDTMSNKTYGTAEVQEKFGVMPEQIRDYLALVGDSSDNIPGVSGIGPKGAVDLLNEYHSLDRILKAAIDGKIAGKKGETLKNHQEDARLSAELAQVKDDLKVELPVESLKYHFHLTQDCIRLLTELDFNTLVAKWKTDKNFVGEVVEPEQSETFASIEMDPRFRTISKESDFKKLLQQMEKKGEFAFDLETTSLNPRHAEIVGISICCEEDVAYYIPIGHREASAFQLVSGESPALASGTTPGQLPAKFVLESLRPFIENSSYKKIGQNLKYDWSVLRAHGWEPSGIGADTMVAAYLLDSSGRHNLQGLAAQYLDYNVLTYEQVCGKGKDEKTFDQIPIDVATRYAAEDAWVALRLWHKLKPLLEKEGVLDLFRRVDLPLIDVLAKMELQGVCIDVGWLQKLSKEFSLELKEIETRIQAYTKEPINLNSPKQLGYLLFEELGLPTQGKTKTGFSTDAKVLETLAVLHEVPRLLIEYREISKLKGTYVDPLPQLRDPKTGKIHTSFHQTVAATGRLSSSDPNLQNIPIRTERGMRIRRAFVPSEGNCLLAVDYSQIELRLLAHMSKDPELIQAFQRNEDVHRRTAGEIFGIAVEEVSDRQRGIAKAINFGLMYGKTAFGLSQELKIPRHEASEMIHRYFERYKMVKLYLEHLIQDAKDTGYATTLMHRKRGLPDIRSKNGAVRAVAERMAMNTPLQGTAADLMKLAMIEIDHQLAKGGYDSKLTIQVHDEVILDCPKGEVKEVEKLVVQAMEGVQSLSVPLKVNVAVGDSWQEL